MFLGCISHFKYDNSFYSAIWWHFPRLLSDISVWIIQAEIDAAVQSLLKMKMDYKQMTGQDYKAGCPPSENSVVSDNGPAADGDGDVDTVNPWDVSTTNAKGVDYDKLIGKITMSFHYNRVNLYFWVLKYEWQQ